MPGALMINVSFSSLVLQFLQKGYTMTKAEALLYIKPIDIAKMYATNISDQTLLPLLQFAKRKHKLPLPVINAMIMYIIIVALDNNLPVKESYYRVVQDDWKKKKIESAAVALDYINKCLDIKQSIQNQDKEKHQIYQPMAQVKVDPEVDRVLNQVFQNIK
jgi:replication initiation and membrane attachment protein DnaB